MRIYRYLFFIIYSRWYKKDKDASLATFSSLIELSIYFGANIVGIHLNLALWIGGPMLSTGINKQELLLITIPLMILLCLMNFFLLISKGRRDKVLCEFMDLPKNKVKQMRLYVALYAFISLMLLAGLPWLYYQIY
ncbi:hypothetical protein BY457_11810 [Marinilabilia salmonicolor]|jgi:hypothetical protein|uniref:hypothetical protein n=1 Tax=Marinilabilia salmonicolor TaxID=989 RepID=UPI000D082928|nr:hypothetical protein [Marinilabilia salmonicolor]PRY95869.1 hypothetical protein BY457_11810 [Marinilabilia salmonicolor]